MKRQSSSFANGSNKRINSGHWTQGLVKTMEDPKCIIKSDHLITVIKDMYPKAEYHYLVLPKENITSIKAVTKNHLKLLQHMDDVARHLINEKHPEKNFKIGYHSEPSMSRLHLHVISDDFNSQCLKNKKHWNSYNTNFFVDSQDIIYSLDKNSKVELPGRDICKKYMETPLKCHKCPYLPKNMPDLKNHLQNSH